jgi:hypothetical protein
MSQHTYFVLISRLEAGTVPNNTIIMMDFSAGFLGCPTSKYK